jgi:hypothetical protein
MLLFALAPPLVRYAAEAKQYGFDAMTACLLLWLATRLEESDLPPRWLALAAIMGVLAPWFSHPSVFVLAGIGLSLFLEALVRRERRRVVNLAILGVVWLAGFALCYWVQMRSIARCPGLLRYWQNEFMPFPPRSQADVKWLIDHALGVFLNPAGFVTPGLAAFCFLVGAHVVGRTSLRRLGFLLLPLAPALVASALRCYPFEGRLLVFLVPALLVLIASGASELMDRIRPRAVGGAALLILLLFPCVCGVRTLAGLVRPEGLRPVLEEVRRQAAAGDAVYVYHGATPQFEFYRTRLGLAPPAVVLGQPPADAGPGYAQELGRVRGHGRVWFVFDLVSDGDKAAFPAYLDHRGRRCLEIRRPRGAWAWLYELADTPP